MFLISKFVYEAMAKSKLHTTTPYLKIHYYLSDNHSQTFYKFRYGARDDNGKVGASDPISLKPGAFTGIWSKEGFELSERVFAIFGHPSDLFSRGLELIHSPFIEPTYKAPLQLVIRNFSSRNVTLTPGEIIGKIVFFDISDTITNAEDLMKEVQESTQNQIRKKAFEAFGKAMYEP